jgi:hypothetical protein
MMGGYRWIVLVCHLDFESAAINGTYDFDVSLPSMQGSHHA